MRTFSAKNKAGRAWIVAVLDAATSIIKIDMDLVTGIQAQSTVTAGLVKRMIDLAHRRTAILYETQAREYVYLSGDGRHITKYILRTYAFDVSDLPEVPEDATDTPRKRGAQAPTIIADDDTPSCEMCGEETRTLGVLGRRQHFRCRSCGNEQSVSL